MDAVLYNKVETEADRIFDLIGGLRRMVVDNVFALKMLSPGNAATPNYYLPSELELVFEPHFQVENNTATALILTGFSGSGWTDTGLRKLTITTPRDRFVNVQGAFSSMQYIESITFTNGLKTTGDFNGVFGGCQRLKEINCVIDVGGSWVNAPFGSCAALETVRFAENCIGKTNPNNFTMSFSSLLTNESLVSIANGLYEGAAKTLTLHATPKAACSTIMGTVSLDAGGTYHIFTADDSGNTSLADFITNTKGWTLA